VRKTAIFLFLFLALAVNTASAAITPEEFIKKTKQHRSRLFKYAFAVFKEFPELFPHVTKSQIHDYFSLHDLPKVMSLRDLQKWGYKHHETLAERFARHNGIDINDPNLPASIKEDLDSARRDLNEIEYKIKEKHWRAKKYSDESIVNLTHLEIWVDHSDVKLFRFREVNIALVRFAAAAHFFERGDINGIRVAIFIENNLNIILLDEDDIGDCVRILQAPAR